MSADLSLEATTLHGVLAPAPQMDPVSSHRSTRELALWTKDTARVAPKLLAKGAPGHLATSKTGTPISKKHPGHKPA